MKQHIRLRRMMLLLACGALLATAGYGEVFVALSPIDDENPKRLRALSEPTSDERVTLSAKDDGNLKQQQDFPLVANSCEDDPLSMGFPHAISEADLPYTQTFDTTKAADTGDYRGSAADEITRPGGHDGFWVLTPGNSGSYLFRIGATKGDSAPIPDHEFERGFAGIGVWEGTCDGGYTEVGTNNRLVGDSILVSQLEAETTYTVIWEDYFVGSTENSVTLSVEYQGVPEGNTLTEAISLNDLAWPFEVAGDTSPNQDLEDSPIIEPADDGSGHGSGSSGLTGADVWYRLPATTPGNTYEVEVLSDGGELGFVDSILSLHAYNFQTHQVSFVDANDDISEEDRLSALTFAAGENLIYYVMVESYLAFDQLPFGSFILKGTGSEDTSSVEQWSVYK